MDDIEGIIEEYGCFGDKKNLWGYQIRISCSDKIESRNYIEFVDGHYLVREGISFEKSKVIYVKETKEEANFAAYKHITGGPREETLKHLSMADQEEKIIDKTRIFFLIH